MPKRVVPAGISFRSEHVRNCVDIRQNRTDDAPLAQLVVRLPNIAYRPTERCMGFQMHDPAYPKTGQRATLISARARILQPESQAQFPLAG